MYGREELEPYQTHINCSFFKSYLAKDADKVMDAMERRIARLTALVEGWKKNSVILGEMYHKRLEDVQNTMATENVDLGMENFKLKERINELEAKIPKWISVKDRLPKGNPMLPALTEDGNKIWWGAWHDDNLEIYGITHWLDNAFPPSPTTEDSSATEKEK